MAHSERRLNLWKRHALNCLSELGVTEYVGHGFSINHAVRVMNIVIEEFPEHVNGDLLKLAVLHDVLEDTFISIEDVRKVVNMGEEYYLSLEAITHINSIRSYNDYIDYVKGFDPARRVKIADLMDHLDVKRIHNLEGTDLVKRYEKALKKLEDKEREDTSRIPVDVEHAIYEAQALNLDADTASDKVYSFIEEVLEIDAAHGELSDLLVEVMGFGHEAPEVLVETLNKLLKEKVDTE